MKRHLLLGVGLLFLTGCAVHRVTVREMQDYDQAIRLAEQQGMDTKLMHQHLVEMLVDYMKNPGEDPYTAAARKASEAAEWSAAASMIQATTPAPVYDPGPMSPGEFQRGMPRIGR